MPPETSLQGQSPYFRVLIFLGIFAGYFLYYFQGIGNVPAKIWDETIYVNASYSYLEGAKPYPNPEHPPLGKQCLAWGIYLFGDGPAGWRVFPVLFGALTCTLVCFLILYSTGRWGVALFVGLLLLFDPFLVVHFRLAMLEAPLTGFLILSTILCFLFLTSEKLNFWLCYLIALSLGLALATKLLPLILAPIFWFFVMWRIHRGRGGWGPMIHASLIFLILPIGIFFGTYLLLGYQFSEIIALVKFMFSWHATFKGPEVFFSRWFEWLYIKIPIWYYLKHQSGNQVQAVLATGNFVLWIGAELATVYCILRKWRNPEIALLATLVGAQFFLYSFKYSTFIHYMTALLPFLYVFLGIALGDLWNRYPKFRRVIQIDCAVFALGALILYLNYFPVLWGRPLSEEVFSRYSGLAKENIDTPPLPTPSPSPL